jgi:hypothetical protein
MGFSAFDVGFGSMLAGTIAIAGGALLAGILTGPLGLGRSLWIFGFLQIFSNLGYAVVAVAPTRLALYGAQVFEMGTSGLGTGAFMVLLLRLTQKRFSATQYALLSSLMSITRVFTGPPAALLVDAFGWRDFYVLTLLAGIPGMVMLWRFVPWSVRDPEFFVAPPTRRAPLPLGGLVVRSVAAGVLCLGLAFGVMAVLGAARTYNSGKVKAVVTSVGASSVELKVWETEGTLAGGVKRIKELVVPVPAGEFELVPQVGDRVTVVRSKGADGVVHLSRKKAVERDYALGPALTNILRPRNLDEGLTTAGLALFSLISGLAVAATLAARRGIAGAPGEA